MKTDMVSIILNIVFLCVTAAWSIKFLPIGKTQAKIAALAGTGLLIVFIIIATLFFLLGDLPGYLEMTGVPSVALGIYIYAFWAFIKSVKPKKQND